MAVKVLWGPAVELQGRGHLLSSFCIKEAGGMQEGVSLHHSLHAAHKVCCCQ